MAMAKSLPRRKRKFPSKSKVKQSISRYWYYWVIQACEEMKWDPSSFAMYSLPHPSYSLSQSYIYYLLQSSSSGPFYFRSTILLALTFLSVSFYPLCSPFSLFSSILFSQPIIFLWLWFIDVMDVLPFSTKAQGNCQQEKQKNLKKGN